MRVISTTRLYGAAIALVSGIYGLGSALDGRMMASLGATWVMVAIGFVVLVHGVVLLTPASALLRGASGPLMVAWAAIMLANQALAGGMGRDAGMVAIAILMLVSGLIMTVRREM